MANELDRSVYMESVSGIYLRMIRDEDTDMVVAWRNSSDVRKRFLYRADFTPESHRRWLRDVIGTGKALQMIICDLHTDKPLGSVYIRDIDRENRKAEFGIFIGEPSARGRGVGTAAARLMLRYCFCEMGLHRVYLRAIADNLQAIRSYEKAGFRKEALLRDDVLLDGKYCDIVLMGILEEENK